METKKVAHNYAKALMQSAKLSKQVDAVLEGFSTVVSAINHNEKLKSVLASPIISIKKKEGLLAIMRKTIKMPDLLFEFLILLCEKKRIAMVGEVYEDFFTKVQLFKGRKNAEIISAYPLSRQEVKTIKQYLTKRLSSEVNIKETVREAILGGVILSFDGFMLDYSIVGHLERLEKKARQIKL